MNAALARPLVLALFVLPATAQVRVDLFEKVPAGSEFELSARQPLTTYDEPAFGFPRVPTRYSDNALPLDRSTPFVLRATFERTYAAGDRTFRLRARGAAALLVDGKEIARTKAQPPNLTGDDPVPPPPVKQDSLVRPAPYPHQDSVSKLHLDAGKHSFVLIAIIGGKGLFPSPGELAVSTGTAGDMERLLGPDTAPQLVDAEWDAYVAAANARHHAADVAHRRQASVAVVAAWRDRHAAIRQSVLARPAHQYKDIDQFIDARLEKAHVKPLPATSDLEFLRRVSVDATGIIPTASEVREYLAEPSHAARARSRPPAQESLLGRQLGHLLAGCSGRESWNSQARPQ